MYPFYNASEKKGNSWPVAQVFLSFNSVIPSSVMNLRTTSNCYSMCVATMVNLSNKLC